MIETSYSNEQLLKWSDEKLRINIEAALATCEAGSGDDDIDYWNELFYVNLLLEQDNRKDMNNQ